MQATDLQLQIREAPEGGGLSTFLELTNIGSDSLGSDWRLYFSMGLTPITGETRVRRVLVEGRYGYLEPGDDWQPPGPGETVSIPIEPWLFSGMELVSRQGFHLVILENGIEHSLGTPSLLNPELQPLSKPRSDWITSVSPHTVLAPRDETPEAEAVPQFVIPAIKEYALSPDRIDFNGITVTGPGVDNEVMRLREYLSEMNIGEGELVVELQLEAGLINDYSVDTDFSGCKIIGQSPAMLFAGLQTFLQLLARTETGWQLPKIAITDHADFEHRCLFLDIARHFHDAAQLRKVIDAMARYKMNRLQLGVTNDEGWRLEIASLPALTAIGGLRSWQQFDDAGKRRALAPAWGDGPEDYGGYLSANDFIELLRYARDRHIEVIPEINLPGHANALLRSLEDCFDLADPEDTSTYRSAQGYVANVINPGMPDTYRVVRTILNEINDMYRFAGVPLRRIHLGGDEVPVGAWLGSPACQRLPLWDNAWDTSNEADTAEATAAILRYHADNVRNIARDVMPAVEIGFWHEMSPHAGNDAYYTVWTTEAGDMAPLRAVIERQQGFVICNASYLYLDMPYGMAPDEPGLPWAAYVDTRSIFEFDPAESWDAEGELHLVKGLQAQLWSETIIDADRMDYHLFPRLIAVAERAWNRKPVPGTWRVFLAALAKRELPWLASRGIRYRPLRQQRDSLS